MLNHSVCTLLALYLLNSSPIPLHKTHRRIVFAGGDGEISLSLSIANPDLIFKYDILREATSNFKAENKLGQGSFGSVFKVRVVPVIIDFN